jgi:glycosyltransferase involved in cell wall biosynthesis
VRDPDDERTQGRVRVRILIVTGIFPPDIGGPATYVPQIATALAERGHQLTVLTLCDDVDVHDNAYPFRVVRLARRLFKPWRWLLTVVRLIQAGLRADVLFVNGLALEAVLANTLLRKPMVHKVVGDLAWERATNRGWVEDGFEEFQAARYSLGVEALRRLRTWWTRHADKVIVPSQYLARWVVGWGVPAERIVVIYNMAESLSPPLMQGKGRDEGAAPVRGPQPLQIPLTTPVKLVTVGRLVAWKRVDKVIEAITRLREVGLVIIGDGPERASLQELARTLDLTDRIYFAGQRCKKETLALMAACDLSVLNSTYEGLPHMILEAMSLGLPVVATAVGGTPEVVRDGENGRLIAVTNDAMLRNALLELASSPSERQHLADGARQTAKRFCFPAGIKETEAVLMNVASANHGKLSCSHGSDDVKTGQE